MTQQAPTKYTLSRVTGQTDRQISQKQYVSPIINGSELQIRCEKLTSINTALVISSPNPMFDYLLESSR